MGIFGRWSAYGSFGRTIRLIFFSSLLFSALLSICTCGYGLWLVQNRAEYAELLNPSLYVDVARIMIVVSIFALINACVSIWAITKEMRCMIYTTVTASFVIFVMLFIGGIMGFVFRQQLMYQIPLHVKMLTSLRELYGTPEMEGITSAWNELQTNFKCCGVNGTDDLRVWRTSKWYMRQKEPKRRIPMSCCATKDIGSCLKIDLQNPNRSFVYTDTCYELLKADLLSVTRSAAWLSITSSFVMNCNYKNTLAASSIYIRYYLRKAYQKVIVIKLEAFHKWKKTVLVKQVHKFIEDEVAPESREIIPVLIS